MCVIDVGLAKMSSLVVNTLFSKVLGENEKCVFYFYLKLNEVFGQPNIKLITEAMAVQKIINRKSRK